VGCRLTAKKPGLAPRPTLAIGHGTIVLYLPKNVYEDRRHFPKKCNLDVTDGSVD